MSQRRAEQKDRLRAESDYRVNLKAELEIRHLHEKLDNLISKQWQRLAEIQQIVYRDLLIVVAARNLRLGSGITGVSRRTNAAPNLQILTYLLTTVRIKVVSQAL